MSAELMALVDAYADTAAVNGIRSQWAQMARGKVELALKQLPAPQAQADARDAVIEASEQDALRLVRQAVRDFHYALDNRKHGGVAAGAAMNAIELALNMYWQQGQEADRRASLAAQGGEK